MTTVPTPPSIETTPPLPFDLGSAPVAARPSGQRSADPILASSPPAPPEPQSLAETGLSESDLESLILKAILQHGNCTGGQIADIVCLTRVVVAETLDRLREELLLGIKSAAGMNDYVYQLSDAGHQRAKRHAERCRFTGAAPVPLGIYAKVVRQQSISEAKFSLNQLCQAFSDLVLEPQTLSQVGQALNDGRGLFLYGSPGNGKTSIAERVCGAFGQHIWIPKMLTAGGELIRLYDPSCHQAVHSEQLNLQKYDRRWVLIRRPTIVVGGELTLEQLDMQYIPTAGISEAPVHLKSNCGTLVVDDFGRQRVSSSEILNRLIVPLEKQYDFLHLPSGRQIQTPFDQLLVFSTNLEPRDLVDEAFLRRIPYKIEVLDPDEADFRRLFALCAKQVGFELQPGALEYLIETYYKQVHRPFRYCHPRDLMRQAKNFCEVHEQPKLVTKECFDVAVRNYFAGL
jgi:hypothetical protein